MSQISATSASTLGLGFSSRDIENHALVAATEYTLTLALGVKKYAIRFRGTAELELRTVPGGDHWTLDPGNTWEESGLSPVISHTIYITSNKTGILEVISWT